MSSNPNYIHDNETDISTKDSSIKEIDHVSTHTSDLSTVTVTSHKTDYIIVLVLFIINLLNYIDRFTIAGVLNDIKLYYGGLTNSEAGLLQTSFIISYMIFSPVFGYLGDRFNRKWIIIGGITFWSLITLSSSFVPKNMFPLFVVMRSLVGIGEASYSTVAPTIISDLFTGDHRTKVMAFFYFAVPIGSGSGYIIGDGLNQWFGEWQAALRFTPIVGFVCLILLVILVKEPERGRADGGTHLAASPWKEDIRQLTKNHSFMLITLAFTAVCFVLGCLTWFVVIYINYAIVATFQDPTKISVEMIFGGMTIVAGILGVVVGTELGRRLRVVYPYADTLVCAAGLILAAPFLVVSLVLAKYHLNWAMATVFITQTLLCLNWALVTDMTMSVVIPSRRATASAYQMILSHALGDAGSPYIIGLIQVSIQKKMVVGISEADANYYSMQYALIINAVIAVIGGSFFVLCSFYIVKDKRNVAKVISESQFHYETVGEAYQPEDSQILSNASTPDTSSLQRIT